jgi:phosphosulfolactate synthase
MNSFLHYLPKRASKPRQIGLTLVMDKGLSVAEAENLVSVAEPYIDFIKLGFGTALFTRNLERKLAVYRNSRIAVFCGGSLFEAFIVRNQFDDYLRFLGHNKLDLGSTCEKPAGLVYQFLRTKHKLRQHSTW